MPEPLNLLSLVHLVCLSLCGGLVVTESVIELAPFRKRELHGPAIAVNAACLAVVVHRRRLLARAREGLLRR